MKTKSQSKETGVKREEEGEKRARRRERKIGGR